MKKNISIISFSHVAKTDEVEVKRVHTQFAEKYGNVQYYDFRQENVNWLIAYHLNLLPGEFSIIADKVTMSYEDGWPILFKTESLIVTAFESLRGATFSQSFQKPFTLHIDESPIQFSFVRKGVVLEMKCNEVLAVDKVYRFEVLQFMNAFARFYKSVIVEMLKTYPMLRANKGFVDSIPLLWYMDGISRK